jgi:hypothetical protein
MSTNTNFPVKFLTIGNKVSKGTTSGLYLRWFIKPYLGVIGTSPLYLSQIQGRQQGRCGFRLFYNIESGDEIPKLNPLPLDPILPKETKVNISDVHERPTWKATYHPIGEKTQLQLKLVDHYQQDISYLRFNYKIYRGQELELHYKIYSSNTGTTTNHKVPLHYQVLQENLEEQDSEDLTYAIHVDLTDESISEVTFISNRSVVVGDFYYAGRSDLPFYIWSPEGGADLWTEIPSTKYKIMQPPELLITSITEDEMLSTLKEFYDIYYNIQPHVSEINQISFHFPPLPQFQFNPPLSRDYYADQYGELIKGKYESGNGTDFYISPQDAAAMASNDPAIAYIFGLFRVLDWDQETESERYYKVQGTWPDGKRFCTYSKFDPNLELANPRIRKLEAVQESSDLVIYDYATFRNHHPIHTCNLSWEIIFAPTPPQGPDIWFEPSAYLVLRQKSGLQILNCLSPFFLPQEDDFYDNRLHYLDWYDQYKNTDINKVLDGKYIYYLAGYDIFGQMSDLKKTGRQIDPIPLHMGEIQKPLVTLIDPLDNPIEIPLVVIKTSSGYKLKEYNTEQLKFNFSFFWPWESRYIWTNNRATGNTTFDYFKLLYMNDTPLVSPVVFKIQSNTSSGIQVEVDQVRSDGFAGGAKNSALYDLLYKLDAVDANEQLVTIKVESILNGGSLYFGRQFNITRVTVSPSMGEIILMLLPADGTKKDTIEQDCYVLPKNIEEQTSSEIAGSLYWNLEATNGSGYLGWKTLSSVGEKIQPAQLLFYNGTFIEENKTPNTPLGAPNDLQPSIGLKAYEPPDQEGEYGFIIKLEKTNNLSDYDNFQFIPHDPTSGQDPGEYQRVDLSELEKAAVPISASSLFTPERIFTFYASRIGDDPQDSEKVEYRGDPLSYVSREGNVDKEYILFPDTIHKDWIVIVPNVCKKSVQLSELLANNNFNQDHYLITSLSIAVEAIASSQENEVKNSMQSAIGIKKLSIEEFLPPPVFSIQDKPQPEFGTLASAPGYDGDSLIRVKKIFENYNLENLLDINKQYFLYRLPAGRLIPEGFSVEYAKFGSADFYMRNMFALKTKLNTLKSQDGNATNYLDVQSTQKLFNDYAEKVNEQAFNKDSFIKMPVTLPGESQTVFLFSIKAYDQFSGKESNDFTCLSKPVYVEDITPPESPYLKFIEIIRQGNNMSFEFEVSRKLDAVDGYGYVSSTPTLANNPDLLGIYFPHFIGRYRLYACNRTEIISNPDESDFAPVFNSSTPIGGSGKRFCIKVMPTVFSISELDAQTVKISGSVTFSTGIELDNVPSQLFICLRAGNYLGQWSPLSFIPVTYKES